MSYHNRDDRPDTAILILTQREIEVILEALRANVPSGLVNKTPA
jgi:hypothetical protein